jgi:sporulation protein YlmC with PRC-barrel domain
MQLIDRFVRGAIALVAAVALASPAVAQDRSQPPSGGGAGQADIRIGSDSLHGTRVYDTDGKELGSISRLLIGLDGKVASVVIKHGGTAGLGSKEMDVPWDALKLQRGERDRVIATMQRDVLEKAPRAEDSKKDPSASPPTERRR